VTSATRPDWPWLAVGNRLQGAALAAVGEGVLIVDVQGRLMQANAAATAILGVNLVPGSDFEVWGQPLRAHRTSSGSCLEVGAAVMRNRCEARDVDVSVDRPDGASASLSVNYLPLMDAEGAVAGLVLSFRDVTEQERERGQLIEMQERLREAHEVALLSSWEWRPGTDEVIVFHALPENGPQDTAPNATLDDLLRRMGPEDRERALKDVAGLISGTRNACVSRARYRFDSGPLWLETRAKAVRDENGSLLCVRGTSQNVTEQVQGHERLRAARDLFQGTLDSLAAGVTVLDDRGEIVMTNRAWFEFASADKPASAMSSVNYLAACDAADHDPFAVRTAAGLRAIIAGERTDFSIEYPVRGPDGERWFLLRAMRYDGSEDARVVVSREDVTERHQAQARVATQAALLDEVDVAVIAMDADGLITDWNAGAERLYGWTFEEVAGQRTSDLLNTSDRETVTRRADDLRRDGHVAGELIARSKDGSTFSADVRSRVMVDDDGNATGTIAVSVDVSERAAAERALREARDYTRAVAESMGEGLFTLDDGGRLTYMNAAGEQLLGWPREELVGKVMHEVSHHRHGDGSEMSFEDCRIMHARRDGVTVRADDDVFERRDGRPIPVAYTAAPIATPGGSTGCVVVFRDISETKARERAMHEEVAKLSWIGRIQEALVQERLVLYAQPIVDVHTREVVQRELLLRMRDPDGELIAPGLFLPIAEQYGLITDLDSWVIEQAVDIAAGGTPVELNISGRSIGNLEVLMLLEACLERTGADPSLLVFELTETAIVEDQESARDFAERLHAIGCKLALDDFGTGYGGFTYLKQLPADYLKIDIEFVRDLVTNAGSRHVVQAVVDLARGFGMKTVAEGVEDAATFDLLADLGVDFAQGYYIARPQPFTTSTATGEE
jgi:PAS domain S-box-containing protein